MTEGTRDLSTTMGPKLVGGLRTRVGYGKRKRGEGSSSTEIEHIAKRVRDDVVISESNDKGRQPNGMAVEDEDNNGI